MNFFNIENLKFLYILYRNSIIKKEIYIINLKSNTKLIIAKFLVLVSAASVTNNKRKLVDYICE